MMRSFGFVDSKVAEANFFLEQIEKGGFDLFAVRCNFNAFVSSSRSITFSLQAVMSDIEGFSTWYQAKQTVLKANDTAKFFVTVRNVSQKIGDHPVNGGSLRGSYIKHYFSASPDIPSVPAEDVVTACHTYFSLLVELVLNCYEQFGRVIDSDQYYTAIAFAERGLTVDDADEELMGVRGWTRATGVPEEARWQLLRDSVSRCEIDHLFKKYAGRARPTPARISPKVQLAKGWVYIPEALRQTGDSEEDVKLYIAKLKSDRNV